MGRTGFVDHEVQRAHQPDAAAGSLAKHAQSSHLYRGLVAPPHVLDNNLRHAGEQLLILRHGCVVGWTRGSRHAHHRSTHKLNLLAGCEAFAVYQNRLTVCGCYREPTPSRHTTTFVVYCWYDRRRGHTLHLDQDLMRLAAGWRTGLIWQGLTCRQGHCERVTGFHTSGHAQPEHLARRHGIGELNGTARAYSRRDLHLHLLRRRRHLHAGGLTCRQGHCEVVTAAFMDSITISFHCHGDRNGYSIEYVLLQRQQGDKGKKGTTPLSGGVPLIRLNQVSLLGRRRREKIIREMITEHYYSISTVSVTV